MTSLRYGSYWPEYKILAIKVAIMCMFQLFRPRPHIRRRASTHPAAFVRPPGRVGLPTRRHSSAQPAAFVRQPGRVRSPTRWRSSAPAAFVRLGGVRPPRRRSSAPAAIVRPGGVRLSKRRSSAFVNGGWSVRLPHPPLHYGCYCT